MGSKIVNFDLHIKILNYLSYIQSVGAITESQRFELSEYIQAYIIQREDKLTVMSELINSLKEEL